MTKSQALLRCGTAILGLAALTICPKPAHAHWDHDVIAADLITQLRKSTAAGSPSTSTALGEAAGIYWTNCPQAAKLWVFMYLDNEVNPRSTHILDVPYSADGEAHGVPFTDTTEVALVTGIHQVHYYAQGLPWSSVFDWPPLWDLQETMIVP